MDCSCVEVLRMISYPLVMTGGTYGKHLMLPAYQEYSLRAEQQARITRPKYVLVYGLSSQNER